MRIKDKSSGFVNYKNKHEKRARKIKQFFNLYLVFLNQIRYETENGEESIGDGKKFVFFVKGFFSSLFPIVGFINKIAHIFLFIIWCQVIQ